MPEGPKRRRLVSVKKQAKYSEPVACYKITTNMKQHCIIRVQFIALLNHFDAVKWHKMTVVAQSESRHGGGTKWEPSRWWHKVGAFTVVAQSESRHGGGTKWEPSRWWHKVRAVTLVAQSESRHGGGTKWEPSRWWHISNRWALSCGWPMLLSTPVVVCV
jgi:hypothetical protein